MIALLLDKLGCCMLELEIPPEVLKQLGGVPESCVWGNNVFQRRPERDDRNKPQVKCYVIARRTWVIPDTAPSGYWTIVGQDPPSDEDRIEPVTKPPPPPRPPPRTATEDGDDLDGFFDGLDDYL